MWICLEVAIHHNPDTDSTSTFTYTNSWTFEVHNFLWIFPSFPRNSLDFFCVRLTEIYQKNVNNPTLQVEFDVADEKLPSTEKLELELSSLKKSNLFTQFHEQHEQMRM